MSKVNGYDRTGEIVLVEDRPVAAPLIRATLDGGHMMDFSLRHFERLGDALEYLPGSGVRCVLLDLELPDSNGLETVMRVREATPDLPIVVLTDHHNDDEELALQVLREGAQDYLIKEQVDESTLGRSIRYAIERKRAEEKLKQLAADLAQKNRQLQDFASVASHDLQEPLRKIQAFADQLEMKSADALDDQALDYLERIRGAATRMKALIDDLLALSFIRTDNTPVIPIDLGEVVGHTLADLEVLIKEAGAKMEVGDLPTVYGNPQQMRQLFQNLIGNALKYRSESGVPVVKVSSRNGSDGARAVGLRQSSREFCQILVEDNGIGFEERFVDRIFEPSRRLHGRGQYEGTGMGLAICKNIAERHNGDITATSTLAKGSTFIVTLPASKDTAPSVVTE